VPDDGEIERGSELVVRTEVAVRHGLTYESLGGLTSPARLKISSKTVTEA
jgi:hypothetical protein